MIEANGLDADRHGHIREQMVDLITITESFYACGVAASSLRQGPGGSVMPDSVFSNSASSSLPPRSTTCTRSRTTYRAA